MAVLFSAATLSSAANRPAANTAPAEVQARALVNYGKLPLSFEENRGQADSQVRFLSRGSGYAILLTPSEVFLNVRAPGKPGQPAKQSAIRMSFPGAKSSAAIAGGERQSAVSSYFVGNDASKWLSGIPNYSRVHYRGVYPGVDLVVYGNQGRLEYDFEVAPGADPRAIRLAFDGIDGMRIDGAGDLVVSTAAGEMRQHKPIVYQESGGVRHTIDGRYVLQSRNRVAFEVGGYDASKPLVIDPVLSFATYLGSPGDELDFAFSAAASNATYPAVAVDLQGNVYVTGFNGGSAASFTGHPTTLTAAQGGGGSDVFVVKMNPTGALVYDVVFGGGLTDVGGGIAVDSLGNAYVTGFTNSGSNTAHFPITVGAPQSSLNGAFNAFVTKVNATGTALVYSTYLGGSGSFWGRAIGVDRSGNAYVTGTASASGSTSFPLVNPISSTPSAGFLTEVNASGTGFAYSTYLPAGIGYGIAVDSNGDAFVTGSTGTASAPSPAQGYVLKVNAGGTGVGYGPVVLGSSGARLQTVGFGIALDAQNDAYVAGMTNDSNFPQILSGAQTKYGGGLTDGFALKLNSSGGLVYGTYIGGLGSNLFPERGSSIGVDLEGNAYVSGTTQCIGFPVVSPISGARNGGPAVLMEGTLSGSSSNWSPTTLAGPFDQVNALAFDPSGTTLYAGTSALNAAGGGVYKLVGGVWTSASSGITSNTIDAIAVDPIAPSTVYAASGPLIYQTTNGGSGTGSWTIELAPGVGTIAAIAVGKTSSSTSTVYVGGSSGLILGGNGGSGWSNPTTPPGAGAVNAVVADPNNFMTAYAGTPTGVYKTVDGGAHWTAVNTGLPTLNGVAVPTTSLAISGSTETIYAATPNGLFYTTNASAGWTQAILAQEVLSTPLLVAVDAGNNVYLAFEGSGMATGTSGGTQQSDWSSLTYSGLTQNQVVALAVPPSGSGTAYAGIVSATDAFFTKISPDGSTFSSSTCIGGADNDLGQSIAVTPNGAVYLSGATISTNFPVTPGAVQTANAGLSDDFVVGIDIPLDQISSPPPGITLSGSLANFSWNTVSGATQYQLTVGTTPGGTNIFSGTTAGTSQTVDFIPCTGGTIYVQLSAEVNGSFQPAGDNSYPCNSAMGDFNGDHFQDLVWQNNATGQLTVNYFGGASPVYSGNWNWLNTATNTAWKLVGTGDFNGDGVPDLVWQNLTTRQVTVNYYGGTGGATLTGWAYLNAAGSPGWSVVAVADFNGDGVPDLVWQNDTTKQVTVNYYGGTGGATLTGWNWLNFAGGSPGWTVVAAADFDGNGTPDLVWQNLSTRQVTVNYYGQVGGVPTLTGWNWLNSAGSPGWTVVGAKDLNADGVPDLIWQNDTTRQVSVNFYGGAGGAVFEGWNWVNSAGAPGWTVAGVADFDGNGEPDLVWQNTANGQVSVNYYNLGGAVLQGWNWLNTANNTAWRVVGTGDFDGNGVPDLVWQNLTTRQVTVNYYGGTGGTTLTGWAYLNATGSPGWSVVAVADMNGDGVPDLIWQNDTTKQITVNYYGGTGGATLTGWSYLNATGAPGWTVVAAADFDGNGTPDLVWQNLSTGQVTVNYYGGTGGATLLGSNWLSTATNTAWTVVGAADFDGNGVPDLVWENPVTGQVKVNYYGGQGGTTLKGWNWLNNAGSPGWRAIVPKSR